MRGRILLLTCILWSLTSLGQTKWSALEGNWILKDLDNSLVNFYVGGDGFCYGKIIKSDKAIYLQQFIFKGKGIDSKNYIDGIFTTPKSKMKIDTKIYLDSEEDMRFVGKKFLITKTYMGKRVK
jgi:hypothetical protein